ncbi:fibronectin type III domain-containing protein [Candidatus Woesebacteria bacterium]|nr:fibronectin type III domain-containing protein [Candidatus Woesebacteria bacterium]
MLFSALKSGEHNLHENKKVTMTFIALTIFIGLPVLFFIVLTIQGFAAQAGNEAPFDVTSAQGSKSTVTISWKTDKKTQGVVEYGTLPSSLTSYAPEVGVQKEHEVDLTLLTPATTYYFQIKINGTSYDNEGIPWTFTTKTKDGQDVEEAVKGIATRISRELEDASREAELSVCTATTCEEIQSQLGKGCSSEDYIKCISGSVTATPSGSVLSTFSESTPPNPTPTSVLIISNLCKLDYIQSAGDCTEWMWDSYDTKPQTCRNAFDRYILQCRNTSFTSSSDKTVVWYYNNALTTIASNSATMKVLPADGETVYCQVRVQDEMGGESHSTPWVRAEQKCD